jgi:hypothetical protein
MAFRQFLLWHWLLLQPYLYLILVLLTSKSRHLDLHTLTSNAEMRKEGLDINNEENLDSYLNTEIM